MDRQTPHPHSRPGPLHTGTLRAASTAALLALAAGPAGAAAPDADSPRPRTVDTVAELCALPDPTPGEHIEVRGWRRPGDDGGGIFRYDPESALPADGGAVLAPARGGGRFLRLVDPEQDACAEWFGAWGDGDSPAPHADQEAINACLAAYGRVKLLAKTYGVRGTPTRHNPAAAYHAIDLGPGYRIAGSGRDRTTIKLLDGTNPRGDGPGENYFTVLYNRSFHESAEHVVVRDLTIDCNFDGQDKHTTIHAIGIRGGGALVERVNLRGYGTGRHPETGNSRECFVVYQTLVYKDASSCRRAAVLRDLDFTAPGHNGDVGGKVAEITHIALGGANNFGNLSWILPGGKDPAFDPANDGENENNWWPAYGGLVENCTLHDEIYDPATQQSPLNGITCADCIGLTVRGNRVENFEGTAVFVMSWWNRNTVIVDNRFLGVTAGLALCLMGEAGKPVQCPRHESVLFAHNEIVTGAHPHAPWGTCGVTLFGGDTPAAPRMQSIHIRENSISGRAYTNAQGQRSCPVGIRIQILRAAYHDLRIEDNTLDFPDYADAPWVFPQPHAMALVFFPLALWDEAARAGHVVFRGNRNPDGKALCPLLADWYFKNAAVWGTPPK